MTLPPLSPRSLEIDLDATANAISAGMRSTVHQHFRRRGVVVALSGGVDSSVVAALAVRAFGPDHVFGLLMPERESSPETLPLARHLVAHLGIPSALEDITSILEAAGCYRRRDDAIRVVLPGYGPGWKSKIVLPALLDHDRYRLFSIVAHPPDGDPVTVQLTLDAYLGIVAATNLKQRTRKMLEYSHADRLNYAVAGTPNLLEYDQGFFVKLGDGAADLKPIAHLYKTQVYALARFLGLPADIATRPPTTDTYSLPQSQEEFFFSLPYPQMDLVLFGRNHGYSAADVAAAMGLRTDQVERVYRDIDAKRRAARYLHAAPVLLGPVGPRPGTVSEDSGVMPTENPKDLGRG